MLGCVAPPQDFARDQDGSFVVSATIADLTASNERAGIRTPNTYTRGNQYWTVTGNGKARRKAWDLGIWCVIVHSISALSDV